jgi:hypothetical protein
MKRNIQRNMLRAARRANAEASVNLAQRRAWHANTIAYGFTSLQDVMDLRVAEVGEQVINDAIIESATEYQREADQMLGLLVERTTDYQRRYLLPSGGTLQPIDEWGNPDPVQPTGDYTVAFPIQGGGTAWGDNRVSRELMTVAEANRFALMVEAQDRDWLARHMLAALFTNTTNGWTFKDKDHGDLAIQGLANGDTVEYVRRGGSKSTDDHYLGQASAIDNSNNPFPTIEAELSEHPSNTGDIVVFVPTNVVTAVKALSTFRPANDPNIRRGADVTEFVGSPFVGFGDKFLGYEDSGVLIVEWKRLPNNYLVGMSTGAPPILGMREYPAANLQGLFPEFHSPDGNRLVRRFLRYAGFGVANRVGAVVMEVGDASYDIPTGFSAPLAV